MDGTNTAGAVASPILDRNAYSIVVLSWVLDEEMRGKGRAHDDAIRDALARSEAARREAEERCDALYRIAYGRVDLIVRRDEYEKTDEIISLVGDPPPRATSILSLVEGLVTQRDAAKEQAFVAEKALASERAARESWERESNVANTERIRLHNEVENLVERLGQFEAAGFPNVATVLDRVEAERAAREKAEKRLEESRHTIAISWRDIVNSKELISLPSDVKGDTLADVLAFLLRERIEERAAREAAERELRLANERGSWFRVWAIIETLGISGGGCPDHLVVSHVERLRADLSRAATALRGEDVAVMEAMASAEHDRWSRWYRWQRDNSTPENIARWDRLAATPYSELAEPTKEKDREQVRYALASARAALAGQEVGR